MRGAAIGPTPSAGSAHAGSRHWTARRFGRLSRSLGLNGLRWAHAAIALLVLTFAGVVLVLNYRTEALRVDSEAERLRDLLVTQVHGSLQASANNMVMLARLSHHYGSDMAQLSAMLSGEIENLVGVRTLLMLDAEGRIVGDSRQAAPALGVDVSDREYFQTHARSGDSDLFVAAPVLSRIDGRWSLPVSRAVRSAAGGLEGVAVVSFSVDALAHLFAHTAADTKTAVLLLRSDGTILARSPTRNDLLGTRLTNHRLMHEVQDGALEGGFVADSPIDGTPRRVVYAKVVPFDLVLAVGYDQSQFVSVLAAKSTPWLLLVALALLVVAGSYLYSRRLYRSLLAEKEAADLANYNKTRILAVTSHELRTPLNAIIGFSDLVGEDRFGLGMPERYRDYLSDVRRAARGLLATVSDLLDASQASQGELRLTPRRFDLIAGLEDCLAQLRAFAAERGQRIDCDFPDAPVEIEADPDRIRQVVANLLHNAIKYAPPGSRVWLSLTVGPDAVEFEVTDSGHGVAPDQQADLFSPFSRGSDPRVATAEGAGLGLYIVRKIVQLHDGTVTYRDAVPHGATFSVRLPRVAATMPAAAGEPLQSDGASGDKAPTVAA